MPEKQIDLNQFSVDVSTSINNHVNSGVPIPYVIAILELIKVELANNHINQTLSMRALKEASKRKPSVEGN